MTEPDWLQLEQLVAEIQRDLAPGAKVTHNAMLYGTDSETKRQIDVLVEQQIGQFQMRIIIDCKDYKKPVDVKGVEEFQGMISDVGAHQGSMVCPAGFSISAKKRAKRLNIALYSVVDTSKHKWRTDSVRIPTVCDFRSAAIGFGVGCYAPVPFMLKPDFLTRLEAFTNDGNSLGFPLPAGIDRWSSGCYPTGPGIYEKLPLFETLTVLADNGYGMRVPLQFTVSIAVKAERYFGLLPLEQVRGLRDEQTGSIITNGFRTGAIDPNVILNQWRRLAHDEPDPATMGIKFCGLIGHRAEDDPRAAPGYNPFWS